MKIAYYSLLVILFLFCFNSPIYMLQEKIIEVGNYYICNLKHLPKENCTVDYDYKKVYKLMCHENIENKGKYSPSFCFKYSEEKDELIVNRGKEEIHETLPGIILRNHSSSKINQLSIYAPFYVAKDVTIVCTCNNLHENEGTTGYIKINIKAEKSFNNKNNYIKGCDYGNNVNELQIFTNSMINKKGFICKVKANPGDVIGINCNNYESNNFNGINLYPNNCFQTVLYVLSFFKLVKMGINNIFPEAKYFPEYSSITKNKNFQKFSNTSYLWIPEKVTKDVKIICYCKYPEGPAIAMYDIKKSE